MRTVRFLLHNHLSGLQELCSVSVPKTSVDVRESFAYKAFQQEYHQELRQLQQEIFEDDEVFSPQEMYEVWNSQECKDCLLNNSATLESLDGSGAKYIFTAQSILTSFGYDPGPIDGLWGPKTQGCVRKFQTDFKAWIATHNPAHPLNSVNIGSRGLIGPYVYEAIQYVLEEKCGDISTPPPPRDPQEVREVPVLKRTIPELVHAPVQSLPSEDSEAADQTEPQESAPEQLAEETQAVVAETKSSLYETKKEAMNALFLELTPGEVYVGTQEVEPGNRVTFSFVVQGDTMTYTVQDVASVSFSLNPFEMQEWSQAGKVYEIHVQEEGDNAPHMHVRAARHMTIDQASRFLDSVTRRLNLCRDTTEEAEPDVVEDQEREVDEDATYRDTFDFDVSVTAPKIPPPDILNDFGHICGPACTSHITEPNQNGPYTIGSPHFMIGGVSYSNDSLLSLPIQYTAKAAGVESGSEFGLNSTLGVGAIEASWQIKKLNEQFAQWSEALTGRLNNQEVKMGVNPANLQATGAFMRQEMPNGEALWVPTASIAWAKTAKASDPNAVANLQYGFALQASPNIELASTLGNLDPMWASSLDMMTDAASNHTHSPFSLSAFAARNQALFKGQEATRFSLNARYNAGENPSFVGLSATQPLKNSQLILNMRYVFDQERSLMYPLFYLSYKF